MKFFGFFHQNVPPQRESKSINAQFSQWILKDDDVIIIYILIMTVIAWQRPERLALGMGFGATGKVN